MARGRKKGKAIKVITSRDFELMKGIAKTGVVSFYDATHVLGIGEKRLKNLEKCKYISSKDVVVEGKKTIKTYYLNSEGKKYIKKNAGIHYFYRSNERQIEHDLKLSSIYYTLNSDERSSWRNENDLIDGYKKSYPGEKLKTMVDATYLSSSGVIAVEVVTGNYTSSQIQEKYRIAAKLGCKGVLKINVR